MGMEQQRKKSRTGSSKKQNDMNEYLDKVSIILPIYNGAKYLAESIDSCLAQTFRGFELVVVDDGSTDATANILASYASCSNLRVIRHDVNQGIAAALNHGFAESRGALLTWTSDDNIYEPQALEVMVKALEADVSLGMVYAASCMIDEMGGLIRPARVRAPEELDEDNCVGGCFLYRREVYQKIGGYKAESFLVEDYEYWLKVRQYFRMKKLDDVLYSMRLHPASLTMTHPVEEVQEKVHKVRKPYVEWGKYACFEADRYLRRGNRWAAFGQALWACVLKPVYYPAWRLLVLSVFPALVANKMREYVRDIRLYFKK